MEILDERTGQEWVAVRPDIGDQPRQAGAYKEPAFHTYDFLTQTTPAAFDFTLGPAVEGDAGDRVEPGPV